MNPAFPFRIAHTDACAIIDREAAARRLPVDTIALARSHGRILADPVTARLPQPPFDNAAMDGFAVRHADLAGNTPLRLVGEQFAGLKREISIQHGECARITTGAPLPQGADTVIMKEHTRMDGDLVHVTESQRLGQNVRYAGEDSKIGDLLIKAGDLMTPARVALAASQGLPELKVAALPTVAVFTTGDELVEPGLPLKPGQIYNSNREQLMGLLREDGVQLVAWPSLPDDPAQMTTVLSDAAHAFDVIITCGGVSAGEKDYLPELLRTQGEILFWKARIKPGMPVLFARGGALGKALLIGLPGNPVSVLATYLVYARRLLDGLQGRPPRPLCRARLSTAWNKRHERLEFLRGLLSTNDTGSLTITPNPADGSHRMRAAADSNALMVLDEGAREYPAGAVVEVLPY